MNKNRHGSPIILDASNFFYIFCLKLIHWGALTCFGDAPVAECPPPHRVCATTLKPRKSNKNRHEAVILKRGCPSQKASEKF